MSFDDLDFDADLTAAQLEEIEEFASRIHVEETFRLVSLAPMVPSTVPRPTPPPLVPTSERIRKAEAAAAALIKKAETKAGELLRKADAAAAALIAKARAAEAKPKKATKATKKATKKRTPKRTTPAPGRSALDLIDAALGDAAALADIATDELERRIAELQAIVEGRNQ